MDRVTRRLVIERALAKATLIVLCVALGLGLAVGVVVLGPAGDIGTDYQFYRDAAARWLAGGGFYRPEQLAGPYTVWSGVDVLYPPTALLLFVPFTFLPAILWWLIPSAVLAICVAGWRPGWWTLCAVVALLLPYRAFGAFLWGNTDMWGAAAVAAGLRWGWPAALLALKPSVLPWAIVGAGRPSFWRMAGLVGMVSVAFWPMWPDYIAVVRNGSAGVGYSVGSLSLYAVPIVAWAANRLREPGLLQQPLRRVRRAAESLLARGLGDGRDRIRCERIAQRRPEVRDDVRQPFR